MSRAIPAGSSGCHLYEVVLCLAQALVAVFRPKTRPGCCKAELASFETLESQHLGLQARSAHAGFDAPKHGYENPLGFDETFERSREISPDMTGTNGTMTQRLIRNTVNIT